jgi:hypothetical protein
VGYFWAKISAGVYHLFSAGINYPLGPVRLIPNTHGSVWIEAQSRLPIPAMYFLQTRETVVFAYALEGLVAVPSRSTSSCFVWIFFSPLDPWKIIQEVTQRERALDVERKLMQMT